MIYEVLAHFMRSVKRIAEIYFLKKCEPRTVFTVQLLIHLIQPISTQLGGRHHTANIPRSFTKLGLFCVVPAF